jgi:hypothetical protein
MNPSFEDTIPCTIYQNLGTWQLQPTYWYSANAGSPDYFNSYYDFNCGSSAVPLNQLGYQNARSGIAYEGFAPFYSTTIPQGLNRREYIGGILSDTLLNAHQYCVSFYIAVAERCKYVIDGIGAYLAIDSAVNYTLNTNLLFIPQIVNPNGNIIYDTLNWVQISGTYLATGGEKYITIGNFKDDSHSFIDSTSGTADGAYYFIDDVSVTDCTVGINNINSTTTQSKLYPNPTKQTQLYYTNTLAANQTGNLQVTDMLGNILATYSLNSGSNKITINTAAYAKGVYVVKVNVVGMAGESLKLVVE